ncbi:MAG: molybdopterin molybdotransferase MoeA [Pyrinomonadaceae bacterium]|nr:molybdopterin molybdotransferase MoeA [Pyrinomonadaceae bacterium]
MISIDEALEIVETNTPVLGAEPVPISACIGRVLAEDIFADMDLPPFDRSQMDGFAVRSVDIENAPAKLRIVGESAAGKGWDGSVNEGEAVRIMTGARVPEGADTVQKVELTEEADGYITILKAAKPENNIVAEASEITKGTAVLETGKRISDNMIATIASFGYETVRVGDRPRVKILATGSEIVDVSETPGKDQIRNSNSWSLAAFAKRINADVEILDIAQDDLDGLKATIDGALENCDLLMISGGVSVGDYDFTKPALREIGCEIFFEKVALKPGKPTVFAKRGDKLIFGLPGNPVSIAVTFFAFVRTSLLKMQGATEIRLQESKAIASHKIKAAKGRDSLLPVTLSTDDNGRRIVETLRFSGSSNFIRFALSNGLCFIERDQALKEGDKARVFELEN